MDGPPRRLNGIDAEPRTGSAPVVFLSVGEPSGDLHGAALARALRARIPGVRLIGLGGPRMAAEGVELLAGVEDLAVMGFIEVLSRLPFFLRLRRRVFDALRSEGVDLIVPVDYPGFNLRLARRGRELGIPVLYYIAPQVWAWHASRARTLAQDASRIAVILPFEEAFLREHGAVAEFVGHPLLDRPPATLSRAEWMTRMELDPDRPLLGLFPGSRRQEVERHLGVFTRAADRVRQANPEVQVLVARAPGLDESSYQTTPFRTTSEAGELLRHATAAIVKSGTTTLEAALAGTPFVVAYQMNPLTHRLARRVVRVPHIALANLVAGARVVPELIQEEATPEALADAVLPLLDPSNENRVQMISRLGGVRAALRKGGAGERVAEIAAELLHEGRSEPA